MTMRTTGLRRAGAVFVMMGAGLAMAMVAASPALADDSGITPVDSHGISPLDYVMSWNEGAGSVLGVAATPGTTMPAGFMSLAFGAFTAMGWLWGSVYKLFVKLDWLGPLVRVAEDVSSSISRQFGESFIMYVVGATLLLTVAIFALRNMRGRAWHHLAIALVIMGIGVAITLPVGEAAHLLKMGRDIAVQTGGVVTGKPVSTDPTAPLIDKFQREPVQRWQYGQDLDSLGCGQAWDDAIRAIKSGVMDAEKIKDVPLSCPGGTLGSQMHAFTMNPGGAVYLGFLNPIFMALVTVLVLTVVLLIAGTAVGALIHAALIKPGLIAVGTPAGQSFLARNVIDGYTAAMATCGYLLVLFISGSLTAAVAAAAGSSQEAMLLTTVIMIGSVFGVRKVSKNLRGWKSRSASTILPDGAPNGYGPPSRAPEKARRMTVQAAREATSRRRNKALINAVGKKGLATGAAEGAADVVAPEVMIPAAAVGAAAQHILHAAHNYRGQGAAAYQAGGGVGGSAWGATPAGKGGGVFGSRGGPGTRAANYGGSSVAMGGSAAAARAVAGRSRQKRANDANVNSASRGGSSAAPSQSRASVPLRTSGGDLGQSGARRSPVGAGAVATPNTPTAGGAQRASQGASVRQASGGAPAGGPSGAPAPAGTGAAGSRSRSQSVNTARNAARNYRNRKP